MKVLILAPSFYILHKLFINGFQKNDYSVYHLDYRRYNSAIDSKIKKQIFRLPFAIRNKWYQYFQNKINKIIIYNFDKITPDIVFIYNNELLFYNTLKYFKSKKAKIVFFLGDSPFYTPTNDYYLSLLFYADLIVSPDSFWVQQLKILGIKNGIVDFPGYDESLYNVKTSVVFDKDILFSGRGYVDSWGYKRALFLNHFTKFNFSFYGDRLWNRWFRFFPELEKHFILQKNRLPQDVVISMMKQSKVYPVDANPAILNGVHLRVFETIACGTFPIIEYRKDIEKMFKGVEFPFIKNYNDIENVTKKYLNNEGLRKRILQELKQYLSEQYTPEIVIKRILDKL